MNDDNRRRPSRGGPVPRAEEGAPDPFKDIGNVAREARGQPTTQAQTDDAPDDPGPDLPDAPEAPAEVVTPLDVRASAIIDDASLAIVDNIGALITRAERLKQSIVADTAEAKRRIAANLNHGARILDLSKRMNSELDEIENVHRQQIRDMQ